MSRKKASEKIVKWRWVVPKPVEVDPLPDELPQKPPGPSKSRKQSKPPLNPPKGSKKPIVGMRPKPKRDGDGK